MNIVMDDKLKLKVYGTIYGTLFLIIGILFLAIPYDALMQMIFVFVGLFIVIVSMIPCVYSYMMIEQDKLFLLDAVIYTISIIVGFLLMFQHPLWLVILFAAWILAASVARMIKQKFSLTSVRKEIPMLVFGSMFLFYPMGDAFGIVVKIFGGILVASGLVLLILANLKPKDDNKNDNYPNGGNGQDISSEENKKKDRVVIDAEYKDIN